VDQSVLGAACGGGTIRAAGWPAGSLVPEERREVSAPGEASEIPPISGDLAEEMRVAETFSACLGIGVSPAAGIGRGAGPAGAAVPASERP